MRVRRHRLAKILITLGLIALAVVVFTPAMAYGKPQPSNHPTNKVWPCSYPYPYGACLNG
jgi:hypothetical protein